MARENITTFDYDIYKFGTLVDVVSITITRNGDPDITGTDIEAIFRRCDTNGTEMKTVSIGSGITVTDELNGAFQIDSFINDFPAGKYVYDLKMTFPNDEPRIYLEGTFTSIQASTR